MDRSTVKRIGVLTSSRADYGIYKPLLKALQDSPAFELQLIAFGTHLSPFHGHTLDQILADGFAVQHQLHSLLLSDSQNAIATAAALTALKFADFWEQHHRQFDLVFCLGDRYEMFSAVSAGIPYGIKFAHLHGGETTLGAIDNVYRHAITVASSLHFVAREEFAQRVAQITGSGEGVHVVGALSLDNLAGLAILSAEEFSARWQIDLSLPMVLVTLHPETVNPEQNVQHLEAIRAALHHLAKDHQLVVTMPNADTNSNIFREGLSSLQEALGPVLQLVENFGTQGYFSCMHHARFLLGNTSSGIIEAASFKKWVINVGDRQKGRLAGDNVMHVPFEADRLLAAIEKVKGLGEYTGGNPYDQGGATRKIMEVLKNY